MHQMRSGDGARGGGGGGDSKVKDPTMEPTGGRGAIGTSAKATTTAVDALFCDFTIVL